MQTHMQKKWKSIVKFVENATKQIKWKQNA